MPVATVIICSIKYEATTSNKPITPYVTAALALALSWADPSLPAPAIML